MIIKKAYNALTVFFDSDLFAVVLVYCLYAANLVLLAVLFILLKISFYIRRVAETVNVEITVRK